MAKTQAEKQKAYRNRKKNSNAPVTESNGNAPMVTHGNAPTYPVTPELIKAQEAEGQALLEDVWDIPIGQPIDPKNIASAMVEHSDSIKACRDINNRYAPRTNPDKLNYGPRMNSAELEKAGLKANRVPIPGDYDYSGVGV